MHSQPPNPGGCDNPPCQGGNGNGNGGGCFPPPCVPIDNGIILLLAAGTLLGV